MLNYEDTLRYLTEWADGSVLDREDEEALRSAIVHIKSGKEAAIRLTGYQLREKYGNKQPRPLSLLKAQDATMLQGFLADILSSESILNSVNCHAISLEDASRIIAICACVCDVMSPSGFIHWLKDRIKQDAVLKGCVEE